MTLWHWLGVALPASKKKHDNVPRFILIWGGSTITGQFAIQLGKLSGLSVIAVVSTKNAALATSLGAQHVITRNGKGDAEVVAAIRAITEDSLTMAIDIVSSQTAVHSMRALSRTQQAQIAPLCFLPDDVEVPGNVSIKNVEMKKFVLDRESRRYAVELNGLVASGKVRLPCVEVLKGNLASVPAGLERQKRGDMEGRKLVVTVEG